MEDNDVLLTTVQQRLAAIRERIRQAAERVARDPGEVAVMAVTKTFGVDCVHAALAAGIRLLGENRVQEATAKFGGWPLEFPGAEGAQVHLIGHLQRNKAAAAAALFDCVQSLDKLETGVALQRRLPADGRLAILVEVNTSGELTKAGVAPEQTEQLVDALTSACPALRVAGLMTIGPHTPDQARVRAAFHQLALLRTQLAGAFPDLKELSMGMSGDFEVAVEEGSTMIRVGTGLFGQRPA